MIEGPVDMIEGPEEVEELTDRMEGSVVMTTAVPSVVSMGTEEG